MRILKLLISVVLLTIAALIASAHEDKSHGIHVETLAKSTLSWDGNELPNYPEGKPEVTILRITVPPQTRLPLHYHPYINAGVLLEGKLTVIAESGKTKDLEAGDGLIELVKTPHFGHNKSDEPAVILVVYAGVEGQPVTVKSE